MRPVGFWVNKHFLLSWRSGVEIECSERLGKNISIALYHAADRTIEKSVILSFMDGLNMIVSPLVSLALGYKGTFTRANAGVECINWENGFVGMKSCLFRLSQFVFPK